MAPPDQFDRLGAYIAGLGMRQGPMTAHWLLRALAESGRADEVLKRLTDRDGLGWANVLARGGTFTWESWLARTEGQSESHGWGAQALVDILETLLGLRLAEPGARRVDVVVPECTLASARGTVHTQRGPIKIDAYGNPTQNIYIRKVEKVGGVLQNTVIHTYPAVSQFWTYDPQKFLEQPVYSREFPPCRHC